MVTEQLWWSCTSSLDLVLYAGPLATVRKLSLFACGCCRRIDTLLVSDESRAAVAMCEQVADRELPEGDRLEAYWRSSGPVQEFGARQDRVLRAAAVAANRCVAATVRAGTLIGNVRAAAEHAAEAERMARQAGAFIGLAADDADPAQWQVSILRCMFGPLPFRPTTVELSWLTSDVVTLASGIYDEKAFDRMPILADALQDAGCDNDDVLNHCRDENATHVRGCWVVDLVHGKE